MKHVTHCCHRVGAAHVAPGHPVPSCFVPCIPFSHAVLLIPYGQCPVPCAQALFLCTGHGDVADELAKGVAFFRADRPGTHGMADRRPEVKLMGVHSETVHWEDMNPNFDIHVKLQQPEKERTSPTSFILMEEPGQVLILRFSA